MLLTGASGFVGRPCMELLVERGWEVYATSAPEAPAGGPPAGGAGHGAGVHWRQADLLDAARVRTLIDDVKPSHLLHLAWYGGGDIYGSPENFRWVSAGLELLRAFADAGGRRAVFAGSSAEYNWSGGVCSEASTPLEPASAYGLCKRALSELFDGFLAARESGPTSAWARMFFLYGPHEKPQRLIASVIRSLLRGEPARCSHGRQLRDYLFTLDAAGALVALLDSDLEGAINVASGEATRLADLIGQTAGKLGREDLVELGAVPVPEGEAPLVVADVTRLREELGWRPSWSTGDALEHTIGWWRAKLSSRIR